MRELSAILLLGTLTLAWCASPGMKLYGKGCVECHGDEGKDTSIAPKAISGQKGILEKLKGYQQGSFGGPEKTQMQEALKNLSESDLAAVAAYVESL